MDTEKNIILRQGALACGTLSAAGLEAYMTEKMLARWLPRPMPYAFVAAFPYEKPFEPVNYSLPPHARGQDYVKANKARLALACEELRILYPENSFLPRGNGWPLPIVQAARLSGVGFIGVNGLLILPGYGSAVTLGAILTDLELPSGEDGGYCEDCGLCASACPSGAIGSSGGERFFRRERCVSHISQHTEAPGEQEREWMKLTGLSWGCDICLRACPHNRRRW
jgi:epoxyqueuosine reductase